MLNQKWQCCGQGASRPITDMQGTKADPNQEEARSLGLVTVFPEQVSSLFGSMAHRPALLCLWPHSLPFSSSLPRFRFLLKRNLPKGKRPRKGQQKQKRWKLKPEKAASLSERSLKSLMWRFVNIWFWTNLTCSSSFPLPFFPSFFLYIYRYIYLMSLFQFCQCLWSRIVCCFSF